MNKIDEELFESFDTNEIYETMVKACGVAVVSGGVKWSKDSLGIQLHFWR